MNLLLQQLVRKGSSGQNIIASPTPPVEQAPVFTLQPESSTVVTEPTGFILTAEVDNALTYQWYESSAGLLEGQESNVLTISETVEGTYTYILLATNLSLSTLSNIATVTVNELILPGPPVAVTGAWNPPDGVVGESYIYPNVANSLFTGDLPMTFALNGTPPAGMTFNTLVGFLLGTPTTAATYSGLSVTATNAHGSDTTSIEDIIIAASGASVTLSLPISVDSLSNIISGVTTDTANGVVSMVTVLSPSSEPSIPQIVTGVDSTDSPAAYAEDRPVFRSDIPIVFQESGALTKDTDYDIYTVQKSEAGVYSNITKTTQNTYNLPVLSLPKASSPGVGVVTPECTTDYFNGEFYFVVVDVGDNPSAAQVHLGKNASGGAAYAKSVGGDNQVSAAGEYTFAQVTGLTAGNYDLVFAHTPQRSANEYSNTQTVNFTVT